MFLDAKFLRATAAFGLIVAVSACAGGPKVMATMDSREAFDAQGYVTPMRISSKAVVAPSLAYEFASAVPTTLRFDPGQRGISRDQLQSVRSQAAFMRANPSATFTIFGHADASEGAGKTAQSLGNSRAYALKTALVDLGVNPAQIVVAPSSGAAEPTAFGGTSSALNRRTVTELTGTL